MFICVQGSLIFKDLRIVGHWNSQWVTKNSKSKLLCVHCALYSNHQICRLVLSVDIVKIDIVKTVCVKEIVSLVVISF